MKSIIAALLFGALAIVATSTTASAEVKPGKTYNWVYQVVKVDHEDSVIFEYERTYILKSNCEADAKRESKKNRYMPYVCIRKQP